MTDTILVTGSTGNVGPAIHNGDTVQRQQTQQVCATPSKE